ncbi:unnamed protein product [Trifolium pratense]|uniref:Uncharacterized protein n=1 Tax=Trifolium pratense TaxID=57577 RepID=A0ACB0MAC6_TRIPR|nr:unnamed protein product [Trifolium pratense]
MKIMPQSSSRMLKKNPRESTNFSFPMIPPPPTSIYKAKVFVKLDEKNDNFLIWRQLVEPVIEGHRLHMFLTRSAIRRNAGSTRAKARQYASELNNIMKKETESISEYLLRIKVLLDSLDFAGRSVNLQEHANVILGGLPKEYDAAVALINSELLSAAAFSVDDIEYILLAIEKKNKVQNNKESDESNRQSQLSLNGGIFSGQQPIPQLPSANSFLQKYLPNVAASAAASNSQYSPPVWTSPQTLSSYHAALMNMMPPNPMTMSPHSPQPQLPQYPLPPSYSSALPFPNQTTELGLYDRCLVPQ